MIKRFLSWLISLVPFKYKQSQNIFIQLITKWVSSKQLGTSRQSEQEQVAVSQLIPSFVANDETIVRVIFYPKHVTKDKKTLKANAFRSPSGIDEVSIVRLSYSTEDFCKHHGKNIQVPDDDRAYFGLATINCKQIRDLDADVVSSPLENNQAHGDIKIGYICQKGETLPSPYRFKVDEIAKASVLHEDKDPLAENWTGPSLR